MNAILQDYARTFLKEQLAQLPTEWQLRFKQMYVKDSRRKDYTTLQELDTFPIAQVIDEMDKDKLSWAMEQVVNSFKKLNITPRSKLQQFFDEVARLTSHHDVINDHACVTVDKLDNALVKVNAEWWKGIAPMTEEEKKNQIHTYYEVP